MDELGSDKRLELHQILVDLISPYAVYFQPPSSAKMTYPCVVYELGGIRSDYADSIKYKNKKQYTVTLISKDPDSILPVLLLSLDYCEFDRHFLSDNLNHYVFVLYY